MSDARVTLQPRDRLIVGLDVASLDDARAMVRRLGDTVGFYKVGLELACVGGIGLAAELVKEGKQVFLDLKMHDIPNTVGRATAQVAKLGATFLTVHAYPQTMQAAQSAIGNSGLKLLGVTVLTSADNADLEAAGYRYGVKELVGRRCRQAQEAGIAGIVASAEEVASLRASMGSSLIMVTPGIRPAGNEAGDQKRVMTPSQAITAGADHLVVARPILHAADPRGAAQQIIDEISAAAA